MSTTTPALSVPHHSSFRGGCFGPSYRPTQAPLTSEYQFGVGIVAALGRRIPHGQSGVGSQPPAHPAGRLVLRTVAPSLTQVISRVSRLISSIVENQTRTAARSVPTRATTPRSHTRGKTKPTETHCHRSDGDLRDPESAIHRRWHRLRRPGMRYCPSSRSNLEPPCPRTSGMSAVGSMTPGRHKINRELNGGEWRGKSYVTERWPLRSPVIA